MHWVDIVIASVFNSMLVRFSDKCYCVLPSCSGWMCGGVAVYQNDSVSFIDAIHLRHTLCMMSAWCWSPTHKYQPTYSCIMLFLWIQWPWELAMFWDPGLWYSTQEGGPNKAYSSTALLADSHYDDSSMLTWNNELCEIHLLAYYMYLGNRHFIQNSI